jgi:dephospho-CoA kinase
VLRVGLTGGLGSGKSTVAAMLRELGAHVVEADALGRTLMEPGQPVYSAIVERFGLDVVASDGRLNRARLADLAFRQGRLQELNSIVHLPVIEAQARWMDQIFARDPSAVAVIESALIFEVVRDARARGEKSGVLADPRCESGFRGRQGDQPFDHRGRCAQPPRAPGPRRRESRGSRLCA